MDPRKSFGARIRQLRTIGGLSQEKLAERAGLHRTYIGEVERGEKNISLDNIVKIAGALNAELSHLFEGIRVPSDVRHRTKGTRDGSKTSAPQ